MNVGGPALHVMNVMGALAARWPTLLVTGSVAGDEADMLDEARQRGLPVFQIPELGRRVSPWQDGVALARLVSLLRQVRPDIVCTHTAKAGTLGRLAARMALGRQVRTVHTFHGHVFHGYFGAFLTAGVIRTERALARRTDRILAISPAQRDDLVDVYRVAHDRQVRVVPLGLDLQRFLEVDREHACALRADLSPDDAPVLTCVGRLAPIKNHRLLLDAAGLLAARGLRFRLVLVGGGSEEAALRAQAAALGIADRVRFLGWRRDVAEIYAASDVVVLSSHNEGTPVSLIEALAAGVRVVATDVGGVRDVLDEGRLGTLVAPGRPDLLADSLQAASESRGSRAESDVRRLEIRRRYDVGRLADDLDDVYCEIAGNPG